MSGPRLVNGVFQGGGAKSIAYAGALRALSDRGLWFGSAAGSSAGAITASFIAAGMDPDELEAAIPAGLAAARSPIPGRLGLAVLGKTTSVFEGSKMRTWLNETYARLIGVTDERPVSFRQLHDATGIELYVVALDLADGLPVVFCRRTTPDVEVAGAVVASSAIPGAFPAGRAVFDLDGAATRVHQLIDGGGWANLPNFVFQERAFRIWLAGESRLGSAWTEHDEDGWHAEERRPLVCFVFGEAEPSEHHHPIGFVPLRGADIDRRFDLGPSYTSPKRMTYLLGVTLSSDWVRVIVGLVLAVWVSLSVATLPIAFRRFSTWLTWVPDWLYTFVLVASLALAVIAIVGTIVVLAALMLVSRLLADTLLPAVDAVLGVPMEVPPWVGLGDDSVVIRVPREGLKMIRFDVDEEVRSTAIAAAELGVARQLDGEAGARLDALLSQRRPEPQPYRRPARPEPPMRAPVASAGLAAAVLTVVIAIVAGLAWWVTTSAGTAGIVRIVLGMLAGVVAFGVALAVVSSYTGNQAVDRATAGVGRAPTRRRSVPLTAMTAGAVLVLAAITFSGTAMSSRAETTFEAEVAEAVSDGALQRYVLTAPDGTDVAVTSQRHLRLGERVFVTRNDAGDAELVGALDDWRFGVAVTLAALGIAAIAWGTRARRWHLRCARLEALAASWRAA